MQLTGVLVLSMLLLYQLMFHVDPKKKPLNIALQRIYATLGSRNQLTNANMLEGMLDCFASDYYKFLHPDTILEDKYCFVPEGIKLDNPDCFIINPKTSPEIFQFVSIRHISREAAYLLARQQNMWFPKHIIQTSAFQVRVLQKDSLVQYTVSCLQHKCLKPKTKDYNCLSVRMLWIIICFSSSKSQVINRIRSLGSLYSMRDYFEQHFNRKVNRLNFTHLFIYANNTIERIGLFNYQFHLKLIENDSNVHMNGLLVRQHVNPFLMNKKKFYFRVYVIQVQRQAPKILYLYQVVKIILCQKPFSEQTRESIICEGLPIQSLTFEELDKFLQVKFPFLFKSGINEDIQKQMINQISYALRLQELKPNEPRQFEVYKFDFNFGGYGRIGIIEYNLVGPEEIFLSLGVPFKDSLKKLMNLYFRQRYQTIKTYLYQKMIPQIIENSNEQEDNNGAHLRLKPIESEFVPKNLVEINYLSEISQCFVLDYLRT